MNFVNSPFKITFKASERMFLGVGKIYALRLALNKSLYPFLDCKILARQLSGASNLLRIIIKISNQFNTLIKHLYLIITHAVLFKLIKQFAVSGTQTTLEQEDDF